MITVAFTVSCQRQKYLRRVLESWHKVRGVQDVQLLFSLEPPGRSFPLPEFTRWVHDNFAHARVDVSGERLGCSANTRLAINQAFALGAEFVVLAEEDIEVSADVLEYLCWARDSYRSDGRVKAVCAHALHSAAQPGQVVLVPWFNPLVWGTWPDRWESYIEPRWGGVEANTEGWDHNLRQRLEADGWLSVFPGRSRSRHIGETSTITGYPLSQYFYEGSVSNCFAPDFPPQKYMEVARTPELGLVVLKAAR